MNKSKKINRIIEVLNVADDWTVDRTYRILLALIKMRHHRKK